MKYSAFFPGQGSQGIGMGRELYDKNPEIKTLFDQADSILGYSISKLCFEGPLEDLTLTANAQPAILLVSYASYIEYKRSSSFLPPLSAAGHSLGEYTALVAAEALAFEDAIRLVHLRGKFMQEAVPAGEGKMSAVLGPTVQEILGVIESVNTGVVQVANINCPGQTVVAGNATGVDAFTTKMAEQFPKTKIVPLNVSAPFHSSLMAPAAEKLATELEKVEFRPPQFSVYSNVTAKPYPSNFSATEARKLLKDQVCAPVRWTESVEQIVKDHAPESAIEFGHGSVLLNLMKRIDSKIKRVESSSLAK
jgi:[acyl-carrier-protein] S-malonyltransferase